MCANQIGIFRLPQEGETFPAAGQECGPSCAQSLVEGNKLPAHIRLVKGPGEYIGKDQLRRDFNSWDWFVQALVELETPTVEVRRLVTNYVVPETFVMTTARTAEAVEEDGVWDLHGLAAPVSPGSFKTGENTGV